jgi:hypothetical protein
MILHAALAGAVFLLLAGTPASAGDSANAFAALDDSPAASADAAQPSPARWAPVQFVTGRSHHSSR